MLIYNTNYLFLVLSSPVLIEEQSHTSYADQTEPEDAGKPLLQCYTCSLSESAKVCRGNQNLVPCPGRNAVCRTTFIYSDVLINGTTMQKFNMKYIKTCDTLARTDACEFVCYNYATNGKTCKVSIWIFFLLSLHDCFFYKQPVSKQLRIRKYSRLCTIINFKQQKVLFPSTFINF